MYCIWDDKDEIVFCMFFFFFRSAITLGLYTPNELNQTPLSPMRFTLGGIAGSKYQKFAST